MSSTDGESRGVIDRSLRGSTLASGVRRVLGVDLPTESSVAAAVAGRVTDTVERWVRSSRCYRWSVRDPEPAVVVIDLRETRTLGPAVWLAERAVARVRPLWAESGTRRAAAAVAAGVERLADTRVGRAVGALLAPPGSPERPSAPPDRSDSAADERAEPDTDDRPANGNGDRRDR